FERQLVRWFQIDHDEHFLADTKAEVLAPLDIFGDLGEGAADGANSVERHWRIYSTAVPALAGVHATGYGGVRRTPGRYSLRSAATGSSRVARRAGQNDAPTDTAINNSTIDTSVRGSRVLV